MFKKQPNNFVMNRDEDQPLRTKEDVEKRLHSDYTKAAGNRKLRNS